MGFPHPLDFLGADGGGIGSGPGMAVGALGLARQRSAAGRVLGDGDFLMGVTALWTAVRNGIPRCRDCQQPLVLQ